MGSCDELGWLAVASVPYMRGVLFLGNLPWAQLCLRTPNVFYPGSWRRTQPSTIFCSSLLWPPLVTFYSCETECPGLSPLLSPTSVFFQRDLELSNWKNNSGFSNEQSDINETPPPPHTQLIGIHRCQQNATEVPTRASFSLLLQWDTLGSGGGHIMIMWCVPGCVFVSSVLPFPTNFWFAEWLFSSLFPQTGFSPM